MSNRVKCKFLLQMIIIVFPNFNRKWVRQIIIRFVAFYKNAAPETSTSNKLQTELLVLLITLQP